MRGGQVSSHINICFCIVIRYLLCSISKTFLFFFFLYVCLSVCFACLFVCSFVSLCVSVCVFLLSVCKQRDSPRALFKEEEQEEESPSEKTDSSL